MVIKLNNKFNDTQQMSIIEYKRLYENRVLWFGILDLGYMSKNKEYLFINGNAWTWLILISYLQWLSKTRNKEKIGKEERQSFKVNLLILLIITRRDNIYNMSSSRWEARNKPKILFCSMPKNMEKLRKYSQWPKT